MSFLGDNFCLTTELARTLYYRHAAPMPIFDYHCHLPPGDIADDRRFENLTRVWLAGDHYKWRAMRTNGVDERFCTGPADDWEKFLKWAKTVPYCIGNPLYVWTHLELRRVFGVTELLCPDTARRIYEECSAKLRTAEFSARNLIRRANVRVICTTDDPTDDLRHHRRLREERFEVKVLPTFRPDKAMAVEDPVAYNTYLEKLAAASDTDIRSFHALVEALRKRHAFFHSMGCRLSDHGLETPLAEPYSQRDVQNAFAALRRGRKISPIAARKFKSALMVEFGRMDYEAGWTLQLHIGAMRNNNSAMLRALGPDTGFDSIGDWPMAQPLARYLDRLNTEGCLPKTILYTLNPSYNEVLATMIGNFQDGTIAGKLQFGSAWWFLDQRDGMEKQMTALATMGLLSRFVGMLTDSRSFLSFPRHEYFRRVLCKLLGEWVALGEVPDDEQLLGTMVEDICYGNARRYFGIET